MYTGIEYSYQKGSPMKKLSLILIIGITLFGTLACGLFTALTGSPSEEPDTVVLQPADEVVVVEEEPEIEPEQEGLTQSGVVLFSDDFSDPNSGWDRNDWDNGFTDYVDNAYQVTVKVENYDVWANPYLYFEGDVSVEVDAIKVDGELDDNYGILCRYSGEASSPSYYFFYISSDGYAVIGKVIEGETTYLSSEQMEYTDAVVQGYATNHLQADCIGNSLTFYVNGERVATASDSSLSGGDVGLDGGTFTATSSTFLFDNFVVYQP